MVMDFKNQRAWTAIATVPLILRVLPKKNRNYVCLSFFLSFSGGGGSLKKRRNAKNSPGGPCFVPTRRRRHGSCRWRRLRPPRPAGRAPGPAISLSADRPTERRTDHAGRVSESESSKAVGALAAVHAKKNTICWSRHI